MLTRRKKMSRSILWSHGMYFLTKLLPKKVDMSVIGERNEKMLATLFFFFLRKMLATLVMRLISLFFQYSFFDGVNIRSSIK